MQTERYNGIDEFIGLQLKNWDMARKHYDGLRQVMLKTFTFENLAIQAQFNPHRIISSSAKVDAASISKRPCFLCTDNRPAQQEALAFGEDFVILVNPYPVFNKHLTIPSVEHCPQEIGSRIGMMLRLTEYLKNFTVFYNGPRCGASAPDHFHFQAIARGILPVEVDFETMQQVNLIATIAGVKVFAWTDYLRYPVTLVSDNRHNLEKLFARLYHLLRHAMSAEGEPMMNVLCWQDADEWVVHVFPRKQHRPSQYFGHGEEKILISPAGIDMGGVLVMPRREDFDKISETDIADIFSQVSPDRATVNTIINQLINEAL